MEILGIIGRTMVSGNVEQLKTEIEKALARGLSKNAIINDGLIAAMMSLGEKFKRDEVFIPEVLVAANTMKTAINILGFDSITETIVPKGVIVIGTVRNDMHDIGKNLVALMLKSGGFLVHDLGVDVQPDVFVESVHRYQPEIIALSALLTTTTPEMRVVIDALAAAGLRQKIKVLVGGAPVTEEFALTIGADGYAPDATSAVTEALKILGIP